MPNVRAPLAAVLALLPALGLGAAEHTTVPAPPRLASGRAALDTIASDVSYLPAVHIVGATGVYRTDVWIFNPDPSATAVVDLYYAEADTDGSAAPGIRIKPDLAPRESVALADLVGDPNYFGKASSYGLLEVRGSVPGAPTSPMPLIVTSNTYNVAGAVAGTYGQFSPGQPARSAVSFDDTIGGDLYLTGLMNDANHRTNVVVMNPTTASLEAGVQLVDSVGNPYKTVLVTVPPLSMHQLNDVFYQDFASSSPPQGGPWRVTVFVNTNTGAKALAYATVTDLRTGDPYLVTGQTARP